MYSLGEDCKEAITVWNKVDSARDKDGKYPEDLKEMGKEYDEIIADCEDIDQADKDARKLGLGEEKEAG